MSYVELYKATNDHQYLEKAIVLAGHLLELQVQEPIDNIYHIRG